MLKVCADHPSVLKLVDYFEEQKNRVTIPDMPRNVALPFEMGSKNEIPPLAGL